MGTPNLLFGTIKSWLTEKPSSRMPICRKTCKQTLSNAQPRPWKNTTSKKTSPLSSKKNSTKNTAQPGTALLAATLAVTLPTRPSTLSIFIWDRLLFSCSNLDKWIPSKLSARQQRSHLIHHLVVIPLKVNQLSLCNINKYY